MNYEEYHQTLADMAADRIPKGARAAAMKALDAFEAEANKPKDPSAETRSFLPGGESEKPLDIPVAPDAPDTAFTHSIGPVARSREQETQARKLAGPGAHLGPVTDTERLQQERDKPMPTQLARNDKLASASGAVDLYQPPEFIPPGLGQAQDSMGFTQYGEALPSTFGGKVEHYVEPGLSQFQRDMAPAYGAAYVKKVTEDSPEFKEYADAQWKAIYDQAKQEGRPVVRMKYASDPKWREQTTGDKLFYGGMNALGQLGTAADSAVDTATLTLGTRLLGTHENAQKLESAMPVAATAGSIAGAINPYGAGGLAARGVGKALGPLADIPVLGAAAQQGIGSAATVAGEEGVSRLAGDAPDPEWANRTLVAGGLGALLGGATDVPGRIAEKATRTLREERPDIHEAERIGGRTSAAHGFVGSPDIRALKNKLPPDVTPISHASEYVGDKLVSQANATTEATKQAVERDVQSYYAATKDVREPATELVYDAMRQHAARSDDVGNPLDPAANRRFQSLLGRLSDVEAVSGDGSTALRAAQANVPGARALDAVDAKRAGVNVDGAMQRWAQQNPEQAALAQPEDFTFVVTPRKYSPQQWDEVVDAIDREAKVDTKAGAKDPALNSFLRSARQVRDRFPAVGPAADKAYALEDGNVVTGWSALKQEHADLIQGTKDQVAAGGLRNAPGARPDLQDATSAANAVKAYGEGGHLHPRATELLRQAADEAGVGRELRDVRGLYATDRLKKGAAPTETIGLHGVNPYETLRAGGGRMRLDPVLATLGLPSGQRSTEPGYRPDRGALQNPFRLRGGAPGRAGVALERRPRENTLSPEEAALLRRAIMNGAF